MNIADLVFAVLTALLVFVGYKKGLIVSLLELVKTIVGIPVSYFVSNKYSEPFYEAFVRERMREKIAQQISEKTNIDELAASIKQSLALFGGKFDASSLDKFSGAKLVDYLEAQVFAPVAIGVIQVILFLLTFAVFGLVLSIVIALFKHSSKKDDDDKRSTLKTSNRLLGGVFGLIKAAVIVFAVSTACAYLFKFMPKTDSAFLQTLKDSRVIEFINKYNPLV